MKLDSKSSMELDGQQFDLKDNSTFAPSVSEAC